VNNPTGILFAYAVASRLAYVGFVGIALRRQERDAIYTRRYGEAEGFRRFRRVASIIMNHDAVAFILLCLLTRNTLTLPIPRLAAIVIGVVLVIIGVGIKVWAARTLGSNAYYWHNFFAPNDAQEPVATGPYRFASNPMYTIGYLQTYGLALMLGSLPGLMAAAFAQTAILGMYILVEKPHFERLHAPADHGATE
jgi:protein-S-isoprenylcysteine O-methyltransferase Ste14